MSSTSFVIIKSIFFSIKSHFCCLFKRWNYRQKCPYVLCMFFWLSLITCDAQQDSSVGQKKKKKKLSQLSQSISLERVMPQMICQRFWSLRKMFAMLHEQDSHLHLTFWLGLFWKFEGFHQPTIMQGNIKCLIIILWRGWRCWGLSGSISVCYFLLIDFFLTCSHRKKLWFLPVILIHCFLSTENSSC